MQYKHFSRRSMTKRLGACLAILGQPGLIFGALATASKAKASESNNVVATPAQVEGPFHPVRQQLDTDLDLTHITGRTESAFGEIIFVKGRVLNTQGEPISNVLLDIWQANHYGRYSHPGDRNRSPLDPNFQGWGLVRSDSNGNYQIKTVKPGAYPLKALGGEGWRCRHIHFKLSCEGYKALTTQMYFRGDPLIAQDMEIKKAPETLRELLIADSSVDEQSGMPIYHFDIVMAGS